MFRKKIFIILSFILTTPLLVSAVTKATCGDPTPCTVSDFYVQLKYAYFIYLVICSLLLMKVLVVEIPKYALSGDNASIRATSRKNVVISLLAFIAAGFLPAFLYSIFRSIGINDQDLTPLKSLLGTHLFEHAYAADTSLYRASNATNDPIVFITAITKVALAWFVYPVLLGTWVWSAFLLVYAKGNPEEIKKAKIWLLGSLVATIMLFLAQMTFVAVTQTVFDFFN